MKIGMLDNGMDSLKKGFALYLDYTESVKDKRSIDKEDYLNLKQAILSMHHGIEILLKCILYNKSEFRIIDEIDNNYKSAFKEKIENRYDSVFQTSKATKIHTITYEESLSRIKYFIPNLISPKLEEKLKELNTLRNALTHAEVVINDENINKVFDGLLVEVDILFAKAIGEDYKVAYGYSEIKANYDKYMDYFTSHRMEIKKKAIEVLIKAQEKTKIYASNNGIIYIDDIALAKKFLKCIQEDFHFGMDIYNGYCSGDTTIKVTDDGHIKFWTADNLAEYIIKFKSVIVMVPDIKSNESPVLIFESYEDYVEDENNDFVYEDYDGRTLRGLCIQGEANKIIYNPKDISAFYDKCQYNGDFTIPDFYSIERFLCGQIFACLNFQNLNYGNFHSILRFASNKTGKQLCEQLRAYL